MEIPLLKDIIVIFGLSVFVLFICHKLRIPTIVGFLLTGILSGPYGFGLVKAIHEVEILAEIGVILLLFTIGVEFSFEQLLKIKRTVLIGGLLQVVLTFLLCFIVSTKIGIPYSKSIFIGFLVSLSSTAIVLKLLQEKAEIESLHGQTSLGILIFQDIIIVPMILFTPLLAGASGNIGNSLFILLIKGISIIVIVIVSAKWIVPQMLYQITRTRNRELFLLSIVVICFAIAWLTSSAGLSLALGAFLAGLIISESEYSHQALGNMLPFRDIFTSFFFVSIGMLLDIGFLFEHPFLIVIVTLSILLLKTIPAALTVLILGFPIGTAILVGLTLSQIGEFSFILSRTGLEYNLLDSNIYQMFLAVSVITMAATPFVMAIAPRTANFAMSLPIPMKLKCGFHSLKEIEHIRKKDHLIIIGYGVNGRNLTRAAKVGNIPYVIIEMNPETVREERAKGEPIYYGDGTQEEVLHKANIEDARIMVVAIYDAVATRRITEVARRLNPKVYIIARTRFLQEMKPLYKLGADEVIPEEFETSVEIFTHVLRKYLIPRNEIEKFISEVRSDSYEMFRMLSKESISFSDLKLHLPEVEISTFRIGKGSTLAGKTLGQIDLRRRYGITLLVIHRNSQIISTPGGDEILYEGDILVVMGPTEKISEAAELFHDEDGE